MKIEKITIPEGSTDYYGKEAKIRDYVLEKIEKIYRNYGFEALYTPIIENKEVFNGHHGAGEKLLFNLIDKNGKEYVLKYDSTVPLARVVSMHEDIKLPYKRFQLQQSYRDDEIDKGHYREFIQCDADVVGAYSLINDAEFICMSYEGLNSLGFENFTIRLNHRKIIKAIADLANMGKKEEILEIQRAIDMADKINKSSIEDVEKELNSTTLNKNVINIILDLIKKTCNEKNVNKCLNKIEEYFGKNENAQEAVSELKEIISYLPQNVMDKVKVDFTLARGADYYTGFILEAVINNVKLGAVLGGGRYDDLLSAFSNKKIPAVGMAFGMERIIVSMKELGLDKTITNSTKSRIVLRISKDQAIEAMKIAKKIREKYELSIIMKEDLTDNELIDYCKMGDYTLIGTIVDNDCKLYKIDEYEKILNSKIKIKM